MWLQIGPVMNFLPTKQARSQAADPNKNIAPVFEENHLSAVEALKRKDGMAVRRAISSTKGPLA